MKSPIIFISAITIITSSHINQLDAAKKQELPAKILSADEHFRKGCEAIDQSRWNAAVKEFETINKDYPDSTQSLEGNYFLGLAYFNIEEYDFANDAFNRYLQNQSNPRYFQEAIEYKFYAAEKLREGARKHVLGSKVLPCWSSGYDLALEIYDEVIAALPSNELAAKALFSKACLLWSQKDYRDSVDSFQAVIKRFPNHELAPESYLMITKLYIEQSKQEFQNPDLLAFSMINLRRFEKDFPQEDRLIEAQNDVLQLKDSYAQGLFQTGTFYERIRKPRAAIIYYQKTIADFPETMTAEKARNRLSRLCPHALEFVTPKQTVESEPKEQIDFGDLGRLDG